jgi:hypothetical protein
VAFYKKFTRPLTFENSYQASGARIRFDVEDQSRDPTSSVFLKVRGTAEQRAKALALMAKEQTLYQEERMPLDTDKHFLLIGRGGEIVKALELQTGTAICFTQTPSPAMVVLGQAENCQAAIEEARARIEGENTAAQKKFRVPKEYHAELIGARGKNVQRIERLSGALVHLQGYDSEDCVITGTPAQQQRAWEIIQETMESVKVSRLPVSAELHRTLIGPRGTTIRDLELESGARLSFETEPEACLVARGTEEARHKALMLARKILDDDKEENFYVERRYHGWLIGPRGTRIRDIEEETGTRVLMSREEPVVTVGVEISENSLYSDFMREICQGTDF